MLKYEKAIRFAVEAHQGQVRKGCGEPYIIHPLTVGMLLLDEGCSELVVTAGILHDTVEDTHISLEQIQQEFGNRVKKLVTAVTEPDKTLPWQERKEHTIQSIKTADLDVRMIICADKLHNIDSMISEYNLIGEELWAKFRGDKEAQKWYYQSIVSELLAHQDFPSGIKMFKELEEKVKKFFN